LQGNSKGEIMKMFSLKLLKNQKGQGVMEYVIISSLVGIVCITAVKGFGDVVKKRIEVMKSSITENIKT
jgi:Flp pilus assembly pilin Flp